jgi:hypothetical protein
MDPFTIVVFVGLAVLVLAIFLLGKVTANAPLEQIGLRSARQIMETRESLEAEDLEQMLAAHNARRRARGEREVSLSDVELQVSLDQHAMDRERDRLATEHGPSPESLGDDW